MNNDEEISRYDYLEDIQPKLKRTPESGHSYEGTSVFNTIEEYLKWCEEDELYED